MQRTTIDLLTDYLPKYGWQGYKVVEERPGGGGRILTGWVSPLAGSGRVMFLDVNHGKNTLLLVVPAVAIAPEESMPIGQLADVLTALGFANFALAIGRFAYDPSDGEIRYEYGMPIDATAISFEQFQHMINGAVAAVTYWGPRLKDAAEGDRTGESIVESFLGHARDFAS